MTRMTDTETLRAGTLVLLNKRLMPGGAHEPGTAHQVRFLDKDGDPCLEADDTTDVWGWVQTSGRFTIIGHPDDGWRIHEGDARPVPPDARVECVWANGDQRWGVCGEWTGWAEQGKRRIVAYRLAPQAAGAGCEHTWSSSKLGEPPVFCTKCFMPKVVLAGEMSPHHTALVEAFKAGDDFRWNGVGSHKEARDLAATAYANEHAPKVSSGIHPSANESQDAGLPSIGRPIAESELREGDRVRVTVEGVVSAGKHGLGIHVEFQDGEFVAGAFLDTIGATIRLLSREPEPLKVGDEAMWGADPAVRVRVLGLSGDEAWVQRPFGARCGVHVSHLRRIDAEGGDHG